MRKLLIIILLFTATCSASIFLNSFNSGQLSEDMKQRHDLDRTSMGSEQLFNILICPQGMAYKRPGTEFIADSNDEDVVEEVPPSQIRDEAYVVAGNTELVWFDIDWNALQTTSIGIQPGSSLAHTNQNMVDDDGNVFVSYGTTAPSTGPCNSLFDTELNETIDFCERDGGWESGATMLGATYTDDYDYIFAMVQYVRYTLYKFDASTGEEVWSIRSLYFRRGVFVDSQDRVYCDHSTSGFVRYDSDGNYIDACGSSGPRQAGKYYDEDNDRIYAWGWQLYQVSPNKYRQLMASNWDETNVDYFVIDEDNADQIRGFKKVGDYIYVCGERNNVEGSFASVWKLDTELNLIDSYDYPTYQYNSYGIFLDHDDNLVITHGNSDGGDTHAGLLHLDTDLNYLGFTEVEISIGGASTSGAKLEYMDSGTPGSVNKWGSRIDSRAGVRLIPFEYSTDDAYVLEFGHEYLGFLRTTP